MYLPQPGEEGTIRVTPTTNANEVSIGFYSYTDGRATTAGDMWVLGGNCWARTGNTFSIGTPSTNACLNIATDGSV